MTWFLLLFLIVLHIPYKAMYPTRGHLASHVLEWCVLWPLPAPTYKDNGSFPAELLDLAMCVHPSFSTTKHHCAINIVSVETRTRRKTHAFSFAICIQSNRTLCILYVAMNLCCLVSKVQ